MIKVLLTILSLILGLPLIWIGILHFQDPAWFEPIVPDLIGYPTFWVYASGVFEIVLGIGLIIPKTREISGYGIALMLVVLYAANFNMWVNDIAIGGSKFGTNWHIFRATVQILLISVCIWIGRKSSKQYNLG
ncbi:TPA: hypothetical protein HA324_05075 [Candidatus Thalassarchaeaceae archaeon]|jgi:uncharacterized membrane protein|nr:hypothetical protein [Euryarchaeota archaeon]MDG1547203.1 hypothetical protein [Candidatus Thalassarchaeaceae archaeon]DAC62626.1 MAG TPA: hypothetical protein D7I02_03515 [Candidatus Poseidoniales archaeon]MBT4157149.1 hypothetical protein [Euryarchaeota archaeon]MBT4180241.1 hypothetical protein [Euryarchaeota archaeon]|tara:strand:- start:1124 stop:1522 length:399 start_codon:yes stop_codon:yes gene_type:complete